MAERKQTLFVLRHGDRWDDANPGWVDSRMWDPPLTERGWQRAEETGKKFRTKENVVIKRILVSPFLRCVQTCAGFLKGMYPDGDVSNVKVSIEYGLAELMNNVAIRNPRKPDSDEPWHLPFEKLYSILPHGVVDTSVHSILPKLPEWGEETTAGHKRFEKAFTAVADKFPDEENILCISHGEGIAWSVMYLRPDVLLYEVPYCSYSRAEREVTESPFSAGPWKLVTELGPASGLLYTENRTAQPSEVPS